MPATAVISNRNSFNSFLCSLTILKTNYFFVCARLLCLRQTIWINFLIFFSSICFHSYLIVCVICNHRHHHYRRRRWNCLLKLFLFFCQNKTVHNKRIHNIVYAFLVSGSNHNHQRKIWKLFVQFSVCILLLVFIILSECFLGLLSIWFVSCSYCVFFLRWTRLFVAIPTTSCNCCQCFAS